MTQGYYRQPTLAGERIVFVSENDLWSVPVVGGVARRMTTADGEVSHPVASADGSQIAVTLIADGHQEIHVLSAEGGPLRRLTWLGATTRSCGWTPDGRVLGITDSATSTSHLAHAIVVSSGGGEPERLGLGPCQFLAQREDSGRRHTVLVRHMDDIARWKRYRGGRVGRIWLDAEGEGTFVCLPFLGGNLARAQFFGDGLVFVSDHEGVGNLYRCDLSGESVERLTTHEQYVRHPRVHGDRVVYTAGADLFVYSRGESHLVEVELCSDRRGRQPRYVNAATYLDDYDLNPASDGLVMTVRGKPFTASLFEGAVRQHGEQHGRRYRLPRWCVDGKGFVATVDGETGDRLVRFDQASGTASAIEAKDIGRPIATAMAPKGSWLAVANHRYELSVVDTTSGETRLLDRSPQGQLSEFAWSPDGRWLAYSFPHNSHISTIRVADVASGKTHEITRPDFREGSPCWDPLGRYLYFISCREFDPVYEPFQFQVIFPRTMRLCLIALRPDAENPFIPRPRPVHKTEDKEKKKKDDKVVTVDVDFDGIQDRVLLFPITEGRFSQIAALKDKLFYMYQPIKGQKGRNWRRVDPDRDGTLRVFDFTERDTKDVAKKVSNFRLSRDTKSIIYRSGKSLRVIPSTHDTTKDKGSATGRASGWIDLSRVSVLVDPAAEWAQMFREACQLMRDHFWHPTMGGVDWSSIIARYRPLVDRVGTREELSDLLWELQAELGTSHAYELGGDRARPPSHKIGKLGADFRWNDDLGGYEVVRVIRADAWDTKTGSPLGRVGSGVDEKDVIVAVDGRPCQAEVPLGALLADRPYTRVELTLAPRGEKAQRRTTVRTIRSETPCRYRDWVEHHRRVIDERTGGRVGYIHIPNMGPTGYAEFHRTFVSAVERDGVIVDVRYNRGGHVSQLLLQKLARRRIGWKLSRWRHPPNTYPSAAFSDAMVFLSNEGAGSDGDIFTHGAKLMGLGPVVGTRTWGGVIGIWPRHYLNDKSVVTQPEFSTWFDDVGFGLENYGTDPDYEVDLTPQDWRDGRDPQLDKAIELVMERLVDVEPPTPDSPPPSEG